MDLLNAIDIEVFYYLGGMLLALVVFQGMFKLVTWSKKMPKGALVFLAFFPLISIYPIPPQEIKKIERMKQKQIKSEDESGDPANEDEVS